MGIEGRDFRVVTLNLTDMAIEAPGRPILSSASATIAARLISIISESPLLTAVRGELTDGGIGCEQVERNVSLSGRAFGLAPPFDIRTAENSRLAAVVPIGVISGIEGGEDILIVGNSALSKTGDWRIYTPLIDLGSAPTA